MICEHLVEENLRTPSAKKGDGGRAPIEARSPAWPIAFPKLQPRPLSKAASAHLDLIRAIAAWLVMWGHIRNLFFVDFESVEHASRLVKVIYFFTGFGHESVVVFFVLSGFLIGSTVVKRFVCGNWSWRTYAIDRLTRLYVVLVPGLLFGLIWDKTGSTIFASTGLYSHPLKGFGAGIAQSQTTVQVFLGNLAFLQTLVCPVFGSNGPLWSLANEFWYYVLFPIALSAAVASANKLIRRAVPLTALAVCLAVLLKSPILPGFLIWMAGCIVVIVYWRFSLKSRALRIAYLLTSSTMVIACLLAARTKGSGSLASDFTIGVMFSIFLFGILQMELGRHHPNYLKVARVLAGFSYTLYVFHFPLLLFLRAWLVPFDRWLPNTPHLFYGLIIGMVVLVFAWSLSAITEKKTAVVRGWIDTMIPRLAQASSGHKIPHATQQGGSRQTLGTAQTDC